jgi:hypothetical protein
MKHLSAALLIYLGLASAALAQTPNPTIANCGTAPVIHGNDFLGAFKTGEGGTACTIIFVKASNPARTCLIASQTARFPSYVVTFTTINITQAVPATVYQYMCSTQG